MKNRNLLSLFYFLDTIVIIVILNGNGIDAKTISKQLGHSNASITMNIHTHSFDNKKKVPKSLIH